MSVISHHDLVVLLIGMATMLILSRVASEMARGAKLPVVMGEIVIGIVLGPTLLGNFAPEISNYIFPAEGHAALALNAITKIAVVMMLFVAGMEVQLPLVLKQGKAAVFTSVLSMIIPFFIGFVTAWYFPEWFKQLPEYRLLFALFFGTALAISALPVIARILIDMGLFKTKIGMIIIASAMFNDLIGWLIFSFILSSIKSPDASGDYTYTIFYIIGFGLLMLTVGRKLLDKIMPWMQQKLSWPGGVLSISLGICFLSAAFTESIGIHAILGAFIAGIAIGDSVHLKEKAREIIYQFVTNIFAPLFFVSIGLRVNFVENFDLRLVLLVLFVAYIGKVSGAAIGARIGGFTRNESLAVGFGMNARGAMEIILGTLALQAGLINETIFVALVIMALITSLTSGPLMRLYLDDSYFNTNKQIENN
ncbi:MAG: cation:proton antiporter [Bacteroidota bacterium]|jgi:Kef-type K+ transport system membrane component KefB